MQLTKQTDLSLRVLIFLALHPDKLSTISDIALRYKESKNHLVKVVHKLAALGYLDSVQGRGGGVKLSLSPPEISLGDVVRDMETSLDVIDCETLACPLIPACFLKPILNEATAAFLGVLDEYSLADIAKNKGALLRLVG